MMLMMIMVMMMMMMLIKRGDLMLVMQDRLYLEDEMLCRGSTFVVMDDETRASKWGE